MADGIGKHGRGQTARQQQGFDARTRHDFGGVFGINIGILAAVVADNDAGGRCVKTQDVIRQPFGCLRHQHAVHAHRPCLLPAAQPCRAKLQPPRKAALQLRTGIGSTRFGSVNQRGKFGTGFGIGVLGEPVSGLVNEVHSVSFWGWEKPRF